jgi:hypothetical protein
MASDVTYEIQILTAGQWKTDSMYDERELAVAEAKNIEQTRRGLLALRVVAEHFDESTGLFTPRTVYRFNKTDQIEEEEERKREDQRKSPKPAAKPKAKAAAARKGAPARRPAQKSSGPSWLVISLASGGVTLAVAVMIIGFKVVSAYL